MNQMILNQSLMLEPTTQILIFQMLLLILLKIVSSTRFTVTNAITTDTRVLTIEVYANDVYILWIIIAYG